MSPLLIELDVQTRPCPGRKFILHPNGTLEVAAFLHELLLASRIFVMTHTLSLTWYLVFLSNQIFRLALAPSFIFIFIWKGTMQSCSMNCLLAVNVLHHSSSLTSCLFLLDPLFRFALVPSVTLLSCLVQPTRHTTIRRTTREIRWRRPQFWKNKGGPTQLKMCRTINDVPTETQQQQQQQQTVEFCFG
jgi:hypothetical protein